MLRRYVTADVFTDQPFGGNQLAVVLDAEGLGTAQMQAVAREFNYSETTFVLPPQHGDNTAHVRIFTPGRELPFAGHPNIGTAFVLALGPEHRDDMLFEEAAGLVPVKVTRAHGNPVSAELSAPQLLQTGPDVPLELVAACLTLPTDAIRTDVHAPVVASVGLRFILVEVASRDVLRQAVPDVDAFRRHMPFGETGAIYLYTRDGGHGFDVHSRMFAPLSGIMEDPATGSATVTLAALLASLGGPETLRVQQGADMGRPSVLQTRVNADGLAHVAGACVVMMRGVFEL